MKFFNSYWIKKRKTKKKIIKNKREKNQSLRSLKKLQVVGKNNREKEATH